MNKPYRKATASRLMRIVSRFALIISVLAGLPLSASAGELKAGSEGLYAAHGWARASAGKARNGAVYFVIHMPGEGHDRLLSVESPVAKKAGLHTHKEENGVMRMRPLGELAIGPGEHAVFQPGGNHIMLMGLHAPLKEGESFPLTLHFEKAGALELHVTILGVAAKEFSQGHTSHGHDGHHAGDPTEGEDTHHHGTTE